MHKDQVEGAAKDISGSVKEGIGKATGNDRLAAEGAGERVAGKVQKAVGSVKDAAREALKK
ncbi:CsbD family protein [Phenylobacterium sp.]|uniref:CsbD family protein n=1 Tax=Phenylobacterium sp. TaxID=1871053 RepID=UPI00374C8E32